LKDLLISMAGKNTNSVAACSAFMVELSTLALEQSDPRIFGVVVHSAMLVTLLAYGGAYLTEGIWFSRPWRVVAKYLVDAVIYAAITGAAFAYLS